MTEQVGFAEAANNLSRSLAQLAGTTAQYVRSGVERAEFRLLAERRRRVGILLSAVAVFLWLGVASLFAGFAIITAFWDTHRVLATAAVAGGFLALAAIAAWTFWWMACRRASAEDWITRLIFMFAEYRRWRSP